jgi:phosphate transport system substrate-binding protein
LPGAESWPLTNASYAVILRTPKETRGVESTLKYFDWAFRNGAATAQNLGFVSIPTEVVLGAHNLWRAQIKSRSGISLWK